MILRVFRLPQKVMSEKAENIDNPIIKAAAQFGEEKALSALNAWRRNQFYGEFVPERVAICP